MISAKRIAVLVLAAVVAAACGDVPTGAERSVHGAKPFLAVGSSITGPNPVTCSGFHTYDSNPTGGSGYTYQWSYQVHGDTVTWYDLGTSRTATQWIDYADVTMKFRVVVTSGGQSSTSYLTITGPTTMQVC